jgi:hypothetical protein
MDWHRLFLNGGSFIHPAKVSEREVHKIPEGETFSIKKIKSIRNALIIVSAGVGVEKPVPDGKDIAVV